MRVNPTKRFKQPFSWYTNSREQRPQIRELVDMYSKNSERYVRMHILLAGGIIIAPEEQRTLLELCRTKNHKACELLNAHILGATDAIKKRLLNIEDEGR